ncbi:MAG: sortase [Anaerolineales bacterium]|nr:sortase [Anaerolineales bacterium]
MWFRKILVFVTIFTLAVSTLPTQSVHAAPAFPAGFISETVVSGLTGPTTIAFAPDGRIFIGQKDGRVRVFQNGALLPTDFINISSQVNNFWDRGLLGLALHPDFPNTPYVYLLYTYDPPGTTDNGGGARVSRLLRVSADPSNTNIALPGSEVVLLGTNSTFTNIGNPNSSNGIPSCQSGSVYIQDCIAADSPSHTIGTLVFGTDGSLFVSSGDGAHFNYVDARALRALDVNSLNGKILRINPFTGQGYSDNPFYNGNPNSNRSKVYSLGLRNPFRTTINTISNELFIGDVGWNAWEEIDTGRGGNFGWPCYEGNNITSAQQGSYANAATTKTTCDALYAQGLGAVKTPTYAYNHSSGDSSVQAGGFYQGNVYPVQYQDALFISDYNGDWIRYLTFGVNGNATIHNFGTDVVPVGGIVQLLTGPDTNLYYVAYNGPTPNTSEIRRIRYVAGGNTPPTANASADPDSGYVPLTVNFSSIGSYDPDAQELTYFWDFGDGNTSTDPNPSHTYLVLGNFMATLTVTDSLGETGTDTISIDIGNLQPEANIISPANPFLYNTGDIINYDGTGIDNEDGSLSDASLQWEVLLHHNQHVHFDSILGLTGNTGSFEVPDHGDNTWLELCLTVTDSGGLSDQDCVNLTPNTVAISFDTVPSGLVLEYDGVTYTTPFTVVTGVNSTRDLIAPQIQGCYHFSSWSDGGAASHQIVIGATSQPFIATYLPCPITVTINPGQSKNYGSLDPALTFISSDPSASFTGFLSRTAGETVGSYVINQGTLSVADPEKYKITNFIPANFAISPRPASVTPYPASKTFGSPDPGLSGVLNGFLPSDNITAAYTRAPGETVDGSPYLIIASLGPVPALGNYDIAYNTANFTITKLNSTVTLANLNHTYDGTQKFAIATTNPPGLNVMITYNGSVTMPTNAGSYSVTATVDDTDYAGSAIGTLIIHKAEVDSSITADDKFYDGTTTAIIATRTLTGVLGTDDVSLSGGTANFTSDDVGTWPVIATGLSLSGADAGNYQLSSITANTSASIKKATPTINSAIHDASDAATLSVALGETIHHSAIVEGIGVTPTGNVTFKVFENPTCSGLGSGLGIIPLNAGGVSDPSNEVTASAVELSFQSTYNGDDRYLSLTGPCDVLSIQPAFTSADNAAFYVGGTASFAVTTTGIPFVSSITMTGSLPAGLAFTDNGDGTASLSGTPAVGTEGGYPLTLTATNGFTPDAFQEFTLVVEPAQPPLIVSVNWVNMLTESEDPLAEFTVLTTPLNQLKVAFDQDVISVSEGEEGYEDSVLNPNNFMLIRDNGNGFETISCEDSPGGDDTPITVDSVAYDNNQGEGPFIAILSINSGLPVSSGMYRLYICGTTSITNLFGVALAGSGLPETDFIRNFIVALPIGGGGNNEGEAESGRLSTVSITNKSGILIPVTGFAPGRKTALPTQPENAAYFSTNGLQLDIPALGINLPIQGIRLDRNGWDVTWLGYNAGYLEGSAYPTLTGNTILTGHVTDPNGNPGPFAYIKVLETGDKIRIQVNGLTYTYEVRQSRLIFPKNIGTLFKHENYHWLTLVTCENYNERLESFLYRRMVRAVLISITEDK